MNRLSHAVVLDDEVLRLQAVNYLATFVADQRRYKHYVGLRTERGLLRGNKSQAQKQESNASWNEAPRQAQWQPENIFCYSQNTRTRLPDFVSMST